MGTLLPPPQYDHPPAIPVIERILSYKQLWDVCDRTNGPLDAIPVGSGGPGVLYGCSTIWQVIATGVLVKCEIYLLSNLPDDVHERNRRHELAHCNGWPKDHPR